MSDASPPNGEVWVESTGEGFGQRIRAGQHTLAGDEPASVGGADTGPNPYDLLLASLGTCTSMTLLMYAGRKEWPLESVSVKLRHSRVHARDCEECESESGFVDRIEKELTVVGPLDEAQRERLLQIADRCPVHRTLMNEKQIVSRLV